MERMEKAEASQRRPCPLGGLDRPASEMKHATRSAKAQVAKSDMPGGSREKEGRDHGKKQRPSEAGK